MIRRQTFLKAFPYLLLTFGVLAGWFIGEYL